MMRSPNWQPEELKLALELYLSKDLEWLSRMSDSMDEIVQLSKLLNCLDFYKENKPDNFRSTGSIRMKLSNFKALDSRYGKISLSNVGGLDKDIFREYSHEIEKLRDECQVIIKQHVQGKLPRELEIYVSRYEEGCSISEEFEDFICCIQEKALSLRKRAVDINDLEYSQKILNVCYELIAITTECGIAKKREEVSEKKYHAGINLEPVKYSGEKIGKYVQRSMQRLIENNLLSVDMIEDMQDETWTRRVLHLGHPFLIKIVSEADIKKQITDENGYVRYWTKPYIIQEEKYCVCKEWYEENRKYFEKLLSQIETSIKFELSSEELCSLLKYIQDTDEKSVSISREELKRQIGEGYDREVIVDRLISMGVLREFQGSQRELVVEDYEMVFQMLNEPDKFVM